MARDRPDALTDRLLRHPTATEACRWLTTDDGVRRTLGELNTPESSLKLVERFYRAGAVSVVATEIDRYVRETLHEDDVSENTGHLVIELPHDPGKRRRVLAIQGAIARRLGFDATPDEGQQYVY